MRILHSASGLNTLISLKVQGGGDARVLVKRADFHRPLDRAERPKEHA